MKILSIDQSTVKTGYSIFIDNQLSLYNLIDLSKTDTSERCDKMSTCISNLIALHKPDCVVFEDVSLQTNVVTLVLLARLQGAIIMSCLLNNVPYKVYKPSSWRKVIKFKQGRGIARKELKEQAIQYVKTTFGIETKEDTCEAICIGTAYINENLKGE